MITRSMHKNLGGQVGNVRNADGDKLITKVHAHCTDPCSSSHDKASRLLTPQLWPDFTLFMAGSSSTLSRKTLLRSPGAKVDKRVLVPD